jgi:ATP-binding cassette, subfamily B, bacterial
MSRNHEQPSTRTSQHTNLAAHERCGPRTAELMSSTDVIEDEIEIPSGAALRRAWHSIPELRTGWIGTILFALFGALGRLVVPLIIKSAIDRGFNDRAQSGGVQFAYTAKLCLIGAIGITLTAWSNRTAVVRLGVTSERGLAVLRERAVRRILDLSLQQHSDQRRGVLVARVTSDIESLSEFFSWSAIAWITNIVVMTVVGAAMLIIDWRLALVSFVASIPIVPFMRYMQKRLRVAHGAVREHVANYLGQISELIGAASLIRAYRAETLVGEAAIEASDRRRRASAHSGQQSAYLGIGNEVFQVAAIAAVIGVGLALGSRHALSAGTLVGFVFLVTRFLEPLGELAEVVDQTQRAIAGMVRVLDLLDIPLSVTDPVHPIALPPGPLAISFRNVDFAYPIRTNDLAPEEQSLHSAPVDTGSVDTGPVDTGPVDTGPVDANRFAIENLSFELAPGKTVAVVGATGSGKSTLAKLLVRTADPTGGDISLGNVAISTVAFADLRERVHLVPQDPFLFEATIGENVSMADPTLDTAGQLTLFDELGIGDWIRSLPDGLDTQVGERGGLLSAGERQLVVLARTRACNPDVLVLDEATSSVDATTEARLAETIMHLAEGRTTVVIAHRLTTAARADRVLVMEAGRIVEDGSPAELSELADGHYARLLDAWKTATLS